MFKLQKKSLLFLWYLPSDYSRITVIVKCCYHSGISHSYSTWKYYTCCYTVLYTTEWYYTFIECKIKCESALLCFGHIVWVKSKKHRWVSAILFSGGISYNMEMFTGDSTQENEVWKQGAAFRTNYLLCSLGPNSLSKTLVCSPPSSFPVLPDLGRKQHLCNKSNLHMYRSAVLCAYGRPSYKTRKRPYI